MTKKKPVEIPERTLSDLAYKYGMEVRVFVVLVEADEKLAQEIKVYTKNVKRKASKILPPVIIQKITGMFGEP